jgi:hypothetical protein
VIEAVFIEKGTGDLEFTFLADFSPKPLLFLTFAYLLQIEIGRLHRFLS